MKEFSLNPQLLQSLPNSIRMGIEQLEYDFMKMKHSSYSDEKFVVQIKESIETFLLVLEEAYCLDRDKSHLQDQLNSIEDGIQFISGAITNRLQTGRYLYEANVFNPHNMGPFSTLYLFYESFLDLFERLIVGYNNKKNDHTSNSRVSFLVDISTYSSVHAQQFVTRTCKPIPSNVLVGITINEHAFFQIKATMILLLHEIGHFVRPFDRTKRNKVVLEVVIDWLRNMVFAELNDYLYAEVFSSNGNFMGEEEKQKMDKVRNHFEQMLFPIVDPIISMALGGYFEKFIKTGTVTSRFGDVDPYAILLREFHKLLDLFLTDLSNHLSSILFLRNETKGQTEEDAIPVIDMMQMQSTIMELMQKEVETEDGLDESLEDNQIVYFDILCESAAALFEPDGIFEYKPGVGNSNPDLALDSYLKSLSLLGLNESSKENSNLFTNVLIQCMKRAVESMRDEPVLDMLIRNLDESLAHLFWIRTLNIHNFESYWEIAEPLMKQVAFSQPEQTKYFGIPNAIITEYFALMEGGIQEEYQYTMSPIDGSTPFHAGNGKYSAEAEKKWIDDLRYIVFIPLARYLSDENFVFPENHLFQVEKSKSTISRDGKLIIKLRDQFEKFIRSTESGNTFANEIEMIYFFERNI